MQEQRATLTCNRADILTTCSDRVYATLGEEVRQYSALIVFWQALNLAKWLSIGIGELSLNLHFSYKFLIQLYYTLAKSSPSYFSDGTNIVWLTESTVMNLLWPLCKQYSAVSHIIQCVVNSNLHIN